jgi:lipopolysaccharide transport system ATP-binding protein
MNEVILKAENVSKQYRLGLVGTGTIRDDLKRWWYALRGKENPFLKIGDSNDRASKGNSDYVWALKDINFEVKKGEVLGIIGKNGAGKSTLLKILSKITSPTTGSIKFNGRIASLLEVGTGFHPELTGKENVYLNGAILGMTKTEINDKYDEIVAFSGCERYIDTPVKRYSSGMTVRLAFAVAAFLEPDILIIDEVLAVGDAEFQKKAIGKMQDISGTDGRTVLFVSHNMAAVKSLCTRGIVLENGGVVFEGSAEECISNYISDTNEILIQEWNDINEAPGNEFAKLKKVCLLNKKGELVNKFTSIDDIFIEIEYWDLSSEYINTAIIHVINQFDITVFASNEFNSPEWEKSHEAFGEIIKTTCKIPGKFLSEGNYKILIAVGNYNPNIVHLLLNECLTFSIRDNFDTVGTVSRGTLGEWPGVVRPMLEWKVSKY